ncbi:MAG: DUF262 domain-containing HNH endonuclease family protein [Eubacteriales bacterium]|jgi:uncharacterized protein with ParB-like and HNH nuclease domain|nr:DUF262 domain-containing HNH endonuclease family protein [Eubacteriales bacterium]
MSRIENFKFNIEDAFRECFYIVPDYQREYVWTDKEIHQLLDDINDDINGSAKEYFIGTILVSPTTDNKHYEVIDGQQRLTTFFLILCALKHLFSGESQAQLINELISSSYTNDVGDVVTALKLDPRYENASELMTKLVKIGSDPATTKATILASGIPTFGSLENLLNAYDTVYRYLKDNYSDKVSLKKYWAYLARNVVFIQISTDVSSALKIFETINERGIGLNPMDLLKNLLFTQINKDEFTKLKDKWKKITAPLEKKKEKPLRFLRYYLMANYRIENSRNDYIVREDEIYDWFTNKRNAALCDYQNRPFDFVQHVINNVDRFIDYSSGRGNDGQYNLQMINLKELCGGAFSLHYILLLAASSFPKYLFDHFIVQLESFLFYYIFTKTTTRDLERNFSLWAEELRQIGKEVDRDRQIEGYNRFLTEEFSRNILTKELELSDYLKRYSLNSMQRYRTHYLLAKLTQYVDMAYKGVKTFGALSEYTDLEIELILPNNPRAELRNDFVSRNPEKDYDEYKSKLGNLTLLEKPINIVASNDFFSKKCEEYKKSKYYLTSSIGGLIVVGNNTSINRMNQILLHFEDWSAASIDERQSMLSRLAKEIWKIEEYR